MLEWIDLVSAWLRSWMPAELGMWGLFISAFISATLLPGSSEVVMVALLTAYPEQAWVAMAVATAGNAIGCAVTFAMGWGARAGLARFAHIQMNIDTEGPQVQRLRRFGPPALFLSFVPLVGDAFVLAAGWLKLPPLQSLLWAAAGKAARYLFVVLSVKGLLAFA
jgi:membrane protein YqaA with SNARE-associated domain